MSTFSMLAPAGGMQFAPLSGTGYTADARGLITGVALADVRDLAAAGCIALGAGSVNDAATWNSASGAPQVLAAGGATQGNATAVTGNRVVITVTASTEGVILKAIATGASTSLVVPGSIGSKIYPPVGGKIDATSTNGAITLAAGKGIRLMQRSATLFTVELKGA
jgi:hypothetical protein